MATYGIDLGTTYSCISLVDKTGRPVVLKSADGEDTTPSVVYFESPDNVVVGRQAKDSAVLFPDLVAELVKREMGRDVHYTFHGQEHTPESISALILRELARAAQGGADRGLQCARRPRRACGCRTGLPGARRQRSGQAHPRL